MKKFSIFISYRHSSAGDKAEHLLTLLEQRYRGKVSFDKDNLVNQFDVTLRQRIDDCRDFVVVLGRTSLNRIIESGEKDLELYQWLALSTQQEFEGKIRELGPNYPLDFVRVEIGRALARHRNGEKINIIPVVPERTTDYDFASLKLPVDVAELLSFHAVFYSDSDQRLFKDIMPKLEKRLISRPTRRWWIWIAAACVVVAALACLALYMINESRNKAELQKLTGTGYALVNDSEGKEEQDSIMVDWNPECTLTEVRCIRSIINNMMRVNDSLLIAKFEVTEQEWATIMGTEYKSEEALPKRNITWEESIAFVEKLNEFCGAGFAMPTVEEWQHAAKTGNREEWSYAGSADAGSVAYFRNNSMGTCHEVGSKMPNALEVYDMSGNVAEWCYDENGKKKPICGGSYESDITEIEIESIDWRKEEGETVGLRLIIRL